MRAARSLLFVALLPLFSGCSWLISQPDPSANAGQTLHANGHAPQWSVTVNGKGLLLERACRVDDKANAVVAQPLRKAGGAVVHRQPLGAMAQRVGQRLGLIGAAATHHQLDGGVACQRVADAGAEVTVAAEYQCFQINPASALQSRPPSPAPRA